MSTSTNVNTYQYADLMLDHTSVAMAIFDAQELRLLEANKLYLSIADSLFDFQEEHQPVLGRRLFDGKNEPHTQPIVTIFRTVVETGIPYQGEEFAFVSPRRGMTYWNWTLDPVRAPDGRITHLVQTVSEVTPQVVALQQVEQAKTTLSRKNTLVEAERKRLAVIETVARSVRESLDAEHISKIAIDSISTHLRPISACLHTAYPAQRMLKLLCARNLPGPDKTILKSMDAIPYERLTITKQVLYQSDPVVVEDMQEAAEQGLLEKTNPMVRAGIRGYICVPLWFGDNFEGTLTAIFARCVDAHGPEVGALAGSSTHIAAALAHARLHAVVESERTRLGAILDQLPEGILIAEVSNGSISYANPAAASILGAPLQEIAATPLHRYMWAQTYMDMTLDGRPIPPWNFIAINALCGEIVRGKETIVIRPDSSRVVTLASSAPLYTKDGIMTGAVIVFQDVTAQKSLEQHKNDFFSIVNHELRTPITVIQGFAEILLLKYIQEQAPGTPTDTLTHYALTSISEQSQHLTRLIEEMLDISRIEQTEFRLKQKLGDLLALLKRTIDGQTITAQQYHLHLTLEGLQSRDILTAYIDEERIAQVLNNLLSNAIKYSPIGSEIEVGLRYVLERPFEVLIWVKDQGIGIAPNDIPHIFERFYRARNLDSSQSGFGIGLYLVKEVVTRHGGRVWVESVEGQGSTFYVMLPLNVRK